MSEHTPTPWFVSGVRFRMNGGEWQSINRYDEALKRDENVACVGYEPRTGMGRADAQFIVKACNSHDALVKALDIIELLSDNCVNSERYGAEDALMDLQAIRSTIRRFRASVGGACD